MSDALSDRMGSAARRIKIGCHAWMTSAPGAFLTMRPGGPFDGTIAISVGSEGRLLVEATWKNDGEPRTASQSIEGYAAARGLAHDWADTLAAGREPETT